MKRKFNSMKAWLVSGLMLVAHVADAQFTGSYKFPQNTTYSYGRKPSANSGMTSQDALDSYNSWVTNFVTSSGACGYRRVIWDYYSGGRGATDRSSTVSEGIGYGMLLSAYAGDQSLFSDLWNYYKANRNGNGVMNWQVQNCGVVGANGATDAELDVAMALVVASYQWQSNAYLSDAQSMISIIRNKEFESGSNVLKPGDQFGGSSLTNPSYFSPAYYKVFATIEPAYASFWNACVTKGYAIINAADKNSKGLVPDWVDSNGNTTGAAGSYQDQGKNFIYDAVRTPFRSAIDFLWFGSTQGSTECSRLTDWSFDANGGGTESLGSKYDIAGNKLDASHSNTFIGIFAVAAMAADVSAGGGKKTSAQYLTYLDRAYKDDKNTVPGYGQYFNATYKVLSQFVMTGNFYLPPPDKCTAPNLGKATSLCKGSPVVLNSGITGATSYSWQLNGTTIAGATSATYSATAPGTYEVVVNQAGCVRRSDVDVSPAAIVADFTYSIQASNAVFTSTSTGASDFTWSYNQGTGASTTFATTNNATNAFLTAGSYNITLATTNATFGCTGKSSVTKKIVIGGGIGWVADDFNDHTYSEPWISSTGYAALPKTYCSAADAKLGGAPACSNLPCSMLEVKCTGSAATQYNPFGVNLRANDAAASLNLTGIPFVSIKIRSTANVTLGVGLNDGNATCNRYPVVIKANRDTIINLDFTTYTTGYENAANPNYKLDYTGIKAIQFFPFETTPTFAGTIDIDWIVIGGKSLPAPQFNLKKDANGYLIYENPSKDGVTYIPVPDWQKKVTACTPKATLIANSCTASDIRWFSGTSQIGSGSSIQVNPGIYTVQLINAGGVTTDTVEVSTRNAVANFNVEQVNYDVHFINNSQGYDLFTWSYGDLAHDLAGSTTWDIGYHNYKVAGVGKYNTSLSITDTVCKVTKTFPLVLTIACNQLVSKPVVTAVDSVGCEGKVVTFSIAADPNASGPYGWFPPLGTTMVKGTDTLLTRVITFGNASGPFSIQAYNDCGTAETKIDLNITPKPNANFTIQTVARTVTFTPIYTSAPAATYAWKFGDGATNTSNLQTQAHAYAADGQYSACLDVTNVCGTAIETCQNINILATGILDMNASGDVKVYPTIATSSITVEAHGTITVKIINLAGAVLSTNEMIDNGTFDVSALPAGMYFISLQKGSETVKKQFIKQ